MSIQRPLSRRRVLELLGGAPPLLWAAGCAPRSGGSTLLLPSESAPSDAGVSSFVTITRAGDRLVIASNDIPDHATGAFPNGSCPFGIGPMRYQFTVSASPRAAAQPTPLDGWLFGVAVNGVVFDPTGPFFYDRGTRTGYEFEVMSKTARPFLGLDQNNAHVSGAGRPRPGAVGEYHYHGLPMGLLDRLGAQNQVVLIGYAADGFPIYGPNGQVDPADPTSPARAMRSSYRVKSGRRPEANPGGAFDGTFVEDFEFVPGLGDLDDCNGRFGATAEYPSGTYHYVITADFPFIPRAWRGTPDPSFTHPSPGPDAVPPGLRSYRGA